MSGQNVNAKEKFKSETEAVPKLTISTVSETAKKHNLAAAQVKKLKNDYSVKWPDTCHKITYEILYSGLSWGERHGDTRKYGKIPRTHKDVK